jgi:dephospho-CoA kinase
MKLVALVGMAGSGKSEVSRVFERDGFVRIRFGDITDEEVAGRGLPLTAENERTVRESLRKTLGMEAYAILNRPKIDTAMEKSHVIIDGLYSWEEYVYLKSYYGEQLTVIAVYSSPRTRYNRLQSRPVRPFTPVEAADRDRTEIENINKGGPIAMAEYTIINESTTDVLRKESAKLLKAIKNVPG